MHKSLLLICLLVVSGEATAAAKKNQINKCPKGSGEVVLQNGSGCMSRDGLRVGKWKMWNSGAREYDVGFFVNNVKEGEWQEWELDPERDTYTDTQYLDYYRLAKGNYRNGLREGLWESRTPDTYNSIYQSGKYINGSRVGVWFSRGGNIYFTKTSQKIGASVRIYDSLFDDPMYRKPILFVIGVLGIFLIAFQIVTSFIGTILLHMLWPVRAVVQYLIKE